MKRLITEESIYQFRRHLLCTEKSTQTIRKYLRDIRKFREYAGAGEITKELLVQYKAYLEQNGRYKITSINSYREGKLLD